MKIFDVFARYSHVTVPGAEHYHYGRYWAHDQGQIEFVFPNDGALDKWYIVECVPERLPMVKPEWPTEQQMMNGRFK